MLSPLDFYDAQTLTYYYSGVAILFTFLIYWYILRSGYVVHIMQPLGNVGQTDLTIKRKTEIKDPKDPNKITYEDSTETVKGNTGIYREIAKKKISFSMEGQAVTFFANPRNPAKDERKGKSFFISNQGVSYVHWRNRHIYFDSVSMMPIKLQSGSFKPDSHGWFKLFDLHMLSEMRRGTSTAPAKTRNTNTTIVLVFAVGMALGYFVALFYGHNLSGAFFTQQTTQTSTIISSHVSSAITSSNSNSTSTVVLHP